MLQLVTFITTNFKLILAIAGSTVLIGFLWQAYNVIGENARNKILVEELRQDISTLELELQNKDNIIKIQQENWDEANRLLLKRDREVSILKTELNQILNNLGTDSEDLAPQSLRELIRRLEEGRAQ